MMSVHVFFLRGDFKVESVLKFLYNNFEYSE
jgi:hypothetical protein